MAQAPEREAAPGRRRFCLGRAARAPLFALALFAASPAAAQDGHAGHSPAPPETARVFAVDGLRVDPNAPPPGSAVGRAGVTLSGGTYVHLVYGRPFARGRVVYGGLVAWNAPWVTGAHDATELTTIGPILVAGRPLAAGTYSLVTTPRADRTWTLHLNRGLGSPLADDFDPARDALTVEIRADTLAAAVPVLTFRFEADGPAVALTFAWDRLGFRLPIAAAR